MGPMQRRHASIASSIQSGKNNRGTKICYSFGWSKSRLIGQGRGNLPFSFGGNMPRVKLTVCKIKINEKFYKLQLRKAMRELSEHGARVFVEESRARIPIYWGTSHGGFNALARLAKGDPYTEQPPAGLKPKHGTFEQGGTLQRGWQSGERLSTAKMLWREMKFGFEFNHGVNYFHENDSSKTHFRDTPWNSMAAAIIIARDAMRASLDDVVPTIQEASLATSLSVGRAPGVTTSRVKSDRFFRNSVRHKRGSLGEDIPF
jgi:hypothetical protein